MIGSISKIRPCGHTCHYKYSHAKNVNDLSRIDRNYKSDSGSDGYWRFPLLMAENLKSAFTSSTNSKGFIFEAPKCTNVHSIFRDCNKVKEIDFVADKITDLGLAIYYCFEVEKVRFTDKYNLRYVTNAGYFSERTFKLKDFAGCDLSNVKNGTNMFLDNYQLASFNCPLTNFQFGYGGSGVFASCGNLKELKYPIDEDGTCIYTSGKPQAIVDGVEQWKYVTLPNYNNAKAMFSNCQLDRPTTLSILNSLPNWYEDTAEHNFSIGIHIDHKYDPEVNIALKKLQNSYITPIEEYGAVLPEEITEDKGYLLSVQWKGTATENAYPPPSISETA